MFYSLFIVQKIRFWTIKSTKKDHPVFWMRIFSHCMSINLLSCVLVLTAHICAAATFMTRIGPQRCLTKHDTYSKMQKEEEKNTVLFTLLPPHCLTITERQTQSWAVLIWALHIHRQSEERRQLHRVLKCLIEALQSEYVIASSDSRMKTTYSAAASCLLFKGYVVLIGWVLSLWFGVLLLNWHAAGW